MLLRREVLKRGATIVDRTMVAELLTDGGRVVGGVGIPIDSDGLVVFRAKAVVLAAGAGGFRPTRWPINNLTSDADCMAYRVGAEVTGKEFADPHAGSAIGPGTWALGGTAASPRAEGLGWDAGSMPRATRWAPPALSFWTLISKPTPGEPLSTWRTKAGNAIRSSAGPHRACRRTRQKAFGRRIPTARRTYPVCLPRATPGDDAIGSHLRRHRAIAVRLFGHGNAGGTGAAATPPGATGAPRTGETERVTEGRSPPSSVREASGPAGSRRCCRTP